MHRRLCQNRHHRMGPRHPLRGCALLPTSLRRSLRKTLQKTLSGLSIAIAVTAGGVACGDAPSPQRRSMLLITIDTLRADHLAGTALENSPVLAKLAARGTRFNWAFSAAPTTAPSHVSLLTGQYPGFHSVGTRNGDQRLHESAITLAEVLEQHGYATMAILSNPMLKRRLGLDQGFDSYDDEMLGTELNRGVSEQYADRAIDKALAWLEAKPKGPFFLWLHLQDPHGPYNPPGEIRCDSPFPALEGPVSLPIGVTHMGDGEIPAYQAIEGIHEVATYRRNYACEVAFLDRELGRFIDRLAREPEFAEMLILVTSDHGEAMGEDGFWFAHGHSIAIDQVHVPLIAVGPGIPAAKVVETPVSNVSIFATAIDVLGLDVGDQLRGALVGPSLAAVARGAAAEADVPIFVESMTQVGLIHRNAFLRKDREFEEAWWEEQIANSGGHRKRQGEHFIEPLVASRQGAGGTRAELATELAAYTQRVNDAERALAPLREATPQLSNAEEEALRALGYVE